MECGGKPQHFIAALKHCFTNAANASVSSIGRDAHAPTAYATVTTQLTPLASCLSSGTLLPCTRTP